MAVRKATASGSVDARETGRDIASGRRIHQDEAEGKEEMKPR
jgi:hypothetical protein